MIYHFDSAQTGAPVLPGTAGALRGLLKACLVDGFGAGAVATLTVVSGVATATYAGAHPFAPGRVVEISGATPSALNGKKIVSTSTGASITFPAPGVPDGAATGTISSKAAAPGWMELFAGTLTNVIALKPAVPEATGCVLRVDDTGTTNARVRAYESLIDISTGVGPTPLDSQVSGGLWWPKSGAANAVARSYFLVADERGGYLAVDPQGNGRYTLVYFGDFASAKSGDPYGYCLTGNQADQVSAATVPDGCCGWSHRGARAGAYIVRSHSGLSGAIAASRLGAAHNGSVGDLYSGNAGYSAAAYPNGPNNGLLTTPVELWSQGLRGVLPGLAHIRNAITPEMGSGIYIDGTDDFAGRRLLLLRVAPPTGSAAAGAVLIDVTGPWSR